MSFILDALRKSEHERQRHGGPALAEVAVAARKTRTSAWATAAVILLVANLLAVGILMLRRSRAPDALDEASSASVAQSVDRSAPAAAQPEPLPARPLPQASPATTPPPANAASQRGPAEELPPMLQPADAPVPDAGTRNPLEYEVTGDPLVEDPVLAERGAPIPSGPPAVTELPTRPGSVVYEPPQSGSGASAAPALPTIDEVGLQGGVPELHIDLHVYADHPQGRFVFVNKRKYREGETLQEGPRVEEITRNGVVLSQHGRRFILPRQ